MEAFYDILGIAVASLIGGLAGLVTTLRRQNKQLKEGHQASIEAEANLRMLYESDRKLYEERSNELRGYVLECTSMIRAKDETIATLKDCLKGVGQLHDN